MISLIETFLFFSLPFLLGCNQRSEIRVETAASDTWELYFFVAFAFCIEEGRLVGWLIGQSVGWLLAQVIKVVFHKGNFAWFQSDFGSVVYCVKFTSQNVQLRKKPLRRKCKFGKCRRQLACDLLSIYLICCSFFLLFVSVWWELSFLNLK